MCGAQQLLPGAPLAACGVRDESNVGLLLRLRGGGKGVQLTVQPRVQKEKWSLYWKESMSTKTVSLDPIQLDVDANTTIAEVTTDLYLSLLLCSPCIHRALIMMLSLI